MPNRTPDATGRLVRSTMPEIKRAEAKKPFCPAAKLIAEAGATLAARISTQRSPAKLRLYMKSASVPAVQKIKDQA